MSLIHSPIKGVPISALGINGSDCSLRANSCIYASCLAALMFGRRDYIPVVWAWVISSEKTNHLKDTSDLTEAMWTVMFIENLCNTILENKICCDLSVNYGGATLNIGETILKLVKSAQYACKLDKLNSVNDLFLSSDIIQDELAILSAISKLVYLGTTIATAGFVISVNDPVDSERLNDLIHEIHTVAGVDFTHLPDKIAKGFRSLKGKTDMYSVWSKMSKEVSGSSKELQSSAMYENPEERMECRWAAGDTSKKNIQMREDADNITVSKAIANIGFLMLRAGVPTRLVEGTLRACSDSVPLIDDSLSQYVPVTFMSAESFNKFSKDGETKTLWDLEKEKSIHWHYRYSDDPIADRLSTDARLWGEKGEDITYAFLISEVMKDSIAILSQMYGNVMVEWDKKVLKYSTLTINDSSIAPYAIPCTMTNAIKALLPLIVGRMQMCDSIEQGCVPFITEALFGTPVWVNYVELQIHSKLKLSDVYRVTTV